MENSLSQESGSHQKTPSADQSSQSPINIRLSFPCLTQRYFLTIIAGTEKRSKERRSAERNSHPIKTASNIFFIAGFAVIFYIIAFIAVAIQSSIIEF